MGSAQIQSGQSSQRLNLEVHRKYLSEQALADPQVGATFAAWDDITLQIKPIGVITWDMRELDKMALGGAMQRNPSYLLPLDR